MLTVALDVMGGDYAGEEMVKGAKLALEKSQNLSIKLVGKKGFNRGADRKVIST